MCAGADCIDDIDVVRSGGMKALFDGAYTPSTIGKLLREFTFRHARQLESVLSAAAMCCYGRQARKFLSWLPGPVDSAVRQSDSKQVTSFMVSYCQDRDISSVKATVVLLRGRLGCAHQPCRATLSALEPKPLLCSAIRAAFAGVSGVSSAVHTRAFQLLQR